MCVAAMVSGEPVAFVVSDAPILEPLRHRRRHGGAASAQLADRAQVVALDIRIHEEILNHGRNGGPAADPVALHALRRGDSVPARQQHDRVAVVQRAVHAALHAGHMKKRRDGQQGHLRLYREPAHAGDQRVHGAAVGVHAAFGLTCGTGRVGHDAQIIGPHRQRPPAQLAPQRIAPERHPGPRQLHPGTEMKSGTGRSVGYFQIIRIGGDDHMLEIGACRAAARCVDTAPAIR